MKTISIIILVIFTQGFMLAQKHSSQENNQVIRCHMEYADGKWITTHSEVSEDHQCEELVILNLPPMSQKSTPVTLDLVYKGYYFIKRDQSLKIPAEYHIVIKDLLNGEHYNLNSNEPYPFIVNKAAHQSRFVLEISNNKDNKVIGHLFSGRHNRLL